jgi:hypothetical protein
MNSVFRAAAMLAVNLLFLMVWGFTGLRKLIDGPPSWFPQKFGGTVLAKFPGLAGTFWILAIGEALAFAMAAAALLRGEFLGKRQPTLLSAMLVWSLFLFAQLGFGQWLTSEFNATQQLFMYFCGTLIALMFVAPQGSDR